MQVKDRGTQWLLIRCVTRAVLGAELPDHIQDTTPSRTVHRVSVKHAPLTSLCERK
jgi:hypothetical protein